MKNILVTGYPGFLAYNLAEYLAKSEVVDKYTFVHNRVTFPIVKTNSLSEDFAYYKCDLLDKNEVEWMIEDVEPDVVVHLAAFADNSEPNVYIHMMNNIQMCTNLLNTYHKIEKFIFSSSSSVYGNGDPLEEEEDRYDGCKESTKRIPTSEYGAGKVLCEDLIKIARVKGVIDKFTILRFPAMVGKGLTHGLLNAMLDKVENDEPICLLGKEPGSRKPYLHVEDACEAIVFAVEKYKMKVGIFNICPNDNMDVLEMANLVMEHRGCKKHIQFSGQTWATDNPLVLMSNKLALGWGIQSKCASSIGAVTKALQEIPK